MISIIYFSELKQLVFEGAQFVYVHGEQLRACRDGQLS